MSLRGHGCDGLKFSDRVHSFENNSARCLRDPIRSSARPLLPNILSCLSSKDGAEKSATSRSLTLSGRFAHYKVVDPSFHNWMGLAIAMRDQQISDFPLCNKSFNLSYCGHDL